MIARLRRYRNGFVVSFNHYYMANEKESGFVINSTNIASRISIISRHQSEYNPSSSLLQLSELTPLSEKLQKAIQKVNETHQAYTRSIANRRKEYKQLDALAFRSMQLLKSSDATPEEIKMGKNLFAKYKSIRVKEIPDAGEIKAKASENGDTPDVKYRSVSHLGYTNRLSNFMNIVNFLKSVPAYHPNEEELKTAAMEKVAANIETLNQQRDVAAGSWTTAITERNTIMYKPGGAHDIMMKVMAYVAGSAGKDSAFYQELKKYPVRKKKKFLVVSRKS